MPSDVSAIHFHDRGRPGHSLPQIRHGAGVHRRARHARAAGDGFTLIELVVVLLLLGILVGLAALNLRGQDAGDVRLEAERLAALLTTAQQEAVLQGQVLALAIAPDGYEFLHLDQTGALKPLTTDEVLRARKFTTGVHVHAVEIEGNPQQEATRVVFWPSGDLASFAITLAKGDTRWQVAGSVADGIRPALIGTIRGQPQG